MVSKSWGPGAHRGPLYAQHDEWFGRWRTCGPGNWIHGLELVTEQEINGIDIVPELRRRITEGMTAEQVAESKQRSQTCVASNYQEC